MLDDVIQKLEDLGDPQNIVYKEQKFGVKVKNAFGVYLKDINQLAKEIGKNSEMALALFDSGIYDARILCSKIFKPKDLTEELAEKWISHFDNWEICDSFSMTVFARSSLVIQLIEKWKSRENEFEKRAAFTTLAAYCMADKKASNEVFEPFFNMIKAAANDDRVYVKKAVNWALRGVGKRNVDLHQRAIEVSRELLEIEHKTTQWIAKDALKELEKEGLRMSDYPRSEYRV